MRHWLGKGWSGGECDRKRWDCGVELGSGWGWSGDCDMAWHAMAWLVLSWLGVVGGVSGSCGICGVGRRAVGIVPTSPGWCGVGLAWLGLGLVLCGRQCDPCLRDCHVEFVPHCVCSGDPGLRGRGNAWRGRRGDPDL
jgi:hypothetical protein